jgi:imidazolonepropionase-like amidohydrolase
MRPLRSILCFLAFALSALAPQISAQVAPSTHRIVIAAGTVLDGKGKSLKNVRIAIEVSKIVAVNPDVEGGGMSLSQEQLSAACDEARKQGLRTLVHAYKEAVRAATLAGCTEVEHGTLAPDDDLKLMAEKGAYFDPQCGLVIENYLQNRERYLGTQGYTAEGFAAMEKILPMDHEIVEHATKTPQLKVVFGTDAVAGAHGRNAEEFIDRVRDCGVDPMAAMISANSLGAEAADRGHSTGSRPSLR